MVVVVARSLSHVWLFCNTIDCSPPDSSVHGTSQARILEWVAISFSRWSSRLRYWTHIACTGRQILYHWAIREALLHGSQHCHSEGACITQESMNQAMQGHQDKWVIVKSSDKMWSTVEGNGNPLLYSCLENHMDSMKSQKDMMQEEVTPRSEGD